MCKSLQNSFVKWFFAELIFYITKWKTLSSQFQCLQYVFILNENKTFPFTSNILFGIHTFHEATLSFNCMNEKSNIDYFLMIRYVNHTNTRLPYFSIVWQLILCCTLKVIKMLTWFALYSAGKCDFSHTLKL